MKNICTFLTVLTISVSVFASGAYAQVEFLLNGYQDKYLNYDEGPGAKRVLEEGAGSDKYIYERPTTKALSHLMWSVGLYNVEDEAAVAEFIRINECDIHTNFSKDEFEWQKVLAATKDFLTENKRQFPTRFQFVLPLKMGDYDQKRQAFEIQKDYEIVSVRRFELQSIDFNMPICNKQGKEKESTYPRALVLEFSRPFTLTHVPVPEAEANRYIKEKLDLFKQYYSERHQTKERMYAMRDAYLVLKTKIFTHGKLLGRNYYGIPVVQMMGILEGYEIYEDKDKNNMFFAQSYVKSQNKSNLSLALKDQYDVLWQRSKDRGVLHWK